MAKPLLSVRDLRVILGQKSIVSGVSFDLHAGQFISILGPNGSGKTSLLRAIAGLIPCKVQTCSLDGVDLMSIDVRARANLVGYVPQRFQFSGYTSVIDFVLLGMYPRLRRLDAITAKHKHRAEAIIERVGIAHLKARSIQNLSGGEGQKLLLACALVHDPKLLLLDEPTSSLDLLQDHEMHWLLKSLCVEAGISVIAVSHDLNMSALIASRALVIREGRQLFFGEAQRVNCLEIVQQAFGFSPTFVDHPEVKLQMLLPRLVK